MSKKRRLFEEEMDLGKDLFEEGLENALFDGEDTSLLESPNMYDVVILNDDFTPVDYVVQVLEKFFHKAHEDAIQITLKVHNQGQGICGTFTRDVAETKIMQVINSSRESNHPLKCIMRKEH